MCKLQILNLAQEGSWRKISRKREGVSSGTGHKPNVVMCNRTTENRISTAKKSGLCLCWRPLARRCCKLCSG